MTDARLISERLSLPPRERHLLPSEFVADNQRSRMLHAVSGLVAELGYQKTTIELIAKSARVGLSTFYEHFASKEECFLAAFDSDVEIAMETINELLDAAMPWPDQIAMALEVFVEMVTAESTRAKLCFVASQSAGAAAFARYQASLERVAPKLREGRALNPRSEEMPAGLEVALAGGLAWLVHQRLIGDEIEEIKMLLPEMIQLVLTPYVGEDEAHRAAREAAMRKRVQLPKLRGPGAEGA